MQERKTFDYKDIEGLKQYLDEFGRIKSRKKTGLTGPEQKRMATAVKNARHLALL